MTITSHDGLMLAAETGGAGPATLFIHATGFCKELWRPVTDLIAVRAIAADQRGHGDSESGPAPFDWWDLGRDAGLWSVTMKAPRIGVGHSSGAAALAMSELLAPGTWNGLVLVEPIIFPPPFEPAESHPLVTGALRRRPAFHSRDEAGGAYRGRGPFASWTERALDLYLEYGFRDGPDGERRLACTPETEAEYYRTATTHGAWERLGEIACPVTILVGEHSDSHPRPFAERLAARFQNGELITVSGASHFIPMEKPEAVAGVIAATASRLQPPAPS